MAKLSEYRIQAFRGIDESRSENTLDAGFTPDAYNFDTENGDLAVAAGFTKHINAKVPGNGTIRRMYLWYDGGVEKFVVIAGNKAYTRTSSWQEIFDYTSILPDGQSLDGCSWDFVESRIGNTDYLIIANGRTQMIKWDGTGTAELFGSGEYIFGEDSAVTVAGLTEKFPKATAVSYTETGTAPNKTGAYVLTMPAGYAYEAGQDIAFTVPSIINDVKEITVSDGTNTYTLDYVPEWIGGDIATIRTTSTSTAEVTAEAWGYNGATLSAAIPEDIRTWTKGVGLKIGDYYYAVTEISEDGLTVTFEEITAEIKTGDEVKVRGGISDMATGFIELYYNRLFAAGDPEHPSRLYWSQPPGDTKSIEDWGMDEWSASASGGHTEVGPTSNDPIVGLTALSNQLIIHKESGNYRLIGSNPSNFQILRINSGVERMTNTARISHGDIPYWITRAGLYYYNGQQALLHPNAKQVKKTLTGADLTGCKGLECRDRLYFTMRTGTGLTDNTVLIFDMVERTWMKRTGFEIIDFCTRDGEIYLINGNRYVYKVGGSDYDGEPISAYWRTPITDLGAKRKDKHLREVCFRGNSAGADDVTVFTSYSGAVMTESKFILPESDEEVREVYLKNTGKTFHFEIANEAGSTFRILGGLEVTFDVSEDG